jgi:DNA-binding transcriptional LysR family regulator
LDYLGALAAFVQAAEARNFTVAGQRLGLSSSAVGKAVMRLEEDLGVSLFRRSTRAITLTAEGALFLDRCHRILAELDVARKELTEAAGKPRGRLRVGLPLLGLSFMPRLMMFQQQFPEIELELDFSDRLVNVIDESFDAVVRIGEIEDSRLSMRRLGRYHHHLAASPAYLAQHGKPATPADLHNHRCLRYRYPTSGKIAPWPFQAYDSQDGINVPQSSTTNTIDALADMARAGLGIALLPDFIIAADVAAGRLSVLLAPYIDDERSFCVLWPSSRQQLPKIEAFVTFMAASFKAQATDTIPPM